MANVFTPVRAVMSHTWFKEAVRSRDAAKIEAAAVKFIEACEPQLRGCSVIAMTFDHMQQMLKVTVVHGSLAPVWFGAELPEIRTDDVFIYEKDPGGMWNIRARPVPVLFWDDRTVPPVEFTLKRVELSQKYKEFLDKYVELASKRVLEKIVKDNIGPVGARFECMNGMWMGVDPGEPIKDQQHTTCSPQEPPKGTPDNGVVLMNPED